MALLFCSLTIGSPALLGEDPATWSPAEKAAVQTQHLLGEDSATWGPATEKKPHLLGEDSATWGPTAVTAACDSIKTKDACDKASCSWCLSGAVPPSCKTVDEAKNLPSAVFQCDNLGATASECHSFSTKDKCDSGSCSWCASAAVPSSCKTKDEAKQLPSAVFQCDNI